MGRFKAAKTDKNAASGRTYRNEFHNLVPVADVLVNVQGQGRAHHGIQEELSIWVLLDLGKLLSVVMNGERLGVEFAVASTGLSASWCHGSWSAETESVSSFERPAYFGADARSALSTCEVPQAFAGTSDRKRITECRGYLNVPLTLDLGHSGLQEQHSGTSFLLNSPTPMNTLLRPVSDAKSHISNTKWVFAHPQFCLIPVTLHQPTCHGQTHIDDLWRLRQARRQTHAGHHSRTNFESTYSALISLFSVHSLQKSDNEHPYRGCSDKDGMLGLSTIPRSVCYLRS